MVGLCTSEALVSSSTSFLPRSLWTRGGSEGTRGPKNPLKCVLQVPRSSLAGVGDDNQDDETRVRNRVNTKKRNIQAQEAIVDHPIPAEFIAETNLPTDVGHFRLRAYRTSKGSNEYTGTEPCVIYHPDMSPFGQNGVLKENVPVRIHDQCLTSEVFGSQR